MIRSQCKSVRRKSARGPLLAPWCAYGRLPPEPFLRHLAPPAHRLLAHAVAQRRPHRHHRRRQHPAVNHVTLRRVVILLTPVAFLFLLFRLSSTRRLPTLAPALALLPPPLLPPRRPYARCVSLLRARPRATPLPRVPARASVRWVCNSSHAICASWSSTSRAS